MKKIVVIGAGPAGLSFAYEILSKSHEYQVVILEESHTIGGIARTINHNGNRMDIGGHRFFSKEDRVNDFWKKILPIQGSDSMDDILCARKKPLKENGPDPNKTSKVMLIRNRVSRIFYLNKFFDYPITFKVRTFLNLGFIRTFKSGFSYLKSIFLKRNEDSLENFYVNRFGKQLYSMFFEKYTEKLWGRHPSEISPDWGSQRVKGLSLIAVIKDLLHIGGKETSLIEEFMYPKYGPGQLWEEVAKKVQKMGGEIKFGYKVQELKAKNKNIVSVKCSNGENIDGDIFVSSMPLKDLVLGISDKKNKNILKVASNLPYRDFVTIGLLVKKLKLKNETQIKTINNIIPDCWIYVQDDKVKLGRIQVFNNWSPYLVKDIHNTVWIGLEYFCREDDEFWNMSDAEALEFACNELIKMGIIDKEDVLDYHREKVKKAYPAYFDSYKDINTLVDYVNNYKNLYCIGRNGQHRYNNMDHSVMTGFICADTILNNINDKSDIWNVNTEKEYHEEK